MPFDLSIFDAEAALGLIPTEQIPERAIEALVAGYDGPLLIRMAVLNTLDLWEIRELLPKVLRELRCGAISSKDAAIRLAQIRAKRLLEAETNLGKGLLESVSYFHRLYLAADYEAPLNGLAYFDDLVEYCEPADIERHAREALETVLALQPSA